MRNFEKLGMTREQAERLTIDVTEILCINKEKIAAQFVSKSTLEKVSTAWQPAFRRCVHHEQCTHSACFVHIAELATLSALTSACNSEEAWPAKLHIIDAERVSHLPLAADICMHAILYQVVPEGCAAVLIKTQLMPSPCTLLIMPACDTTPCSSGDATPHAPHASPTSPFSPSRRTEQHCSLFSMLPAERSHWLLQHGFCFWCSHWPGCVDLVRALSNMLTSTLHITTSHVFRNLLLTLMMSCVTAQTQYEQWVGACGLRFVVISLCIPFKKNSRALSNPTKFQGFVKPHKVPGLCQTPQNLVQAVLEQEARIAGFKSEVQKSQELHHSSLTRDTDRLQTMLDKVKAEIRWAAACTESMSDESNAAEACC